MIKLNKTIIDLHGIQYVNPVIVVNYFNMVSSTRKEGSASGTDPLNGQRAFNTFSDCTLSFNALMYASETAAEKGFKPLALRDTAGTEWFNVPVNKEMALADEAELIAACEEFIISFIVPKLEVVNG